MCAGFVIINASPFLSFVLIKLQCYDDFNNQAVIFGSIFVLIIIFLIPQIFPNLSVGRHTSSRQ